MSLFSLSFVVTVRSQANYSPYSMIGLGEIESRDYGRTAGMGNIGIGVRDYDYLNAINPSGISELDSLKFIFDFSVTGKYSIFRSRGIKEETINGNPKKIAIGFRMLPGWGISLGLKPFSDVGYKIYNAEPIEGTTSTKSVYIQGSGGVYRLYLSNGVKITDCFSVGINTELITGIMKQTEDQEDYLFEKESRFSQFYNTFGLQYHTDKLTIGATYGYKQNVKLKNKTSVYDSGYDLVEETDNRSINQFIPETYGLGFSYLKGRTSIGADLKYQRSKGMNSSVSSVKIDDSYSINAGMGYTLGDNRYYRFRDQSQLQFGGSLYKSYLKIGNKNAFGYSVTAGYSMPVNGSLLNLSFEYGDYLSVPNNYIRESYLMMTISVSIIDTWFMKRKFN